MVGMKLLLTSGGLTNDSISDAMFSLVGKDPKDTTITFVPTAMNVEDGDKRWFVDDLVSIQKQNIKELEIADISALPEEIWMPRMEKADVLFFCGGVSSHLLNWMESSRYTDNRVQEVSDISRKLKKLAIEMNIPVLALSQLSRAVEMRTDQRPKLSDLRESGSIEQDADVVMFLHRHAYENDENGQRPDVLDVDLLIEKHRNGPTGEIPLHFNSKNVTYTEVEDIHAEDTSLQEVATA